MSSRLLKNLNILLVFVLFVFLMCDKHKPEEPDEHMLVRIGDKVSISLNEFIRRAEYTPRPPYARMNTYLHKIG